MLGAKPEPSEEGMYPRARGERNQTFAYISWQLFLSLYLGKWSNTLPSPSWLLHFRHNLGFSCPAHSVCFSSSCSGGLLTKTLTGHQAQFFLHVSRKGISSISPVRRRGEERQPPCPPSLGTGKRAKASEVGGEHWVHGKCRVCS